jgi:hypothetical protein
VQGPRAGAAQDRRAAEGCVGMIIIIIIIISIIIIIIIIIIITTIIIIVIIIIIIIAHYIRDDCKPCKDLEPAQHKIAVQLRGELA